MSTTLDFIAKKYNLNLRQMSPISIPNFTRESLALLFAELGFERGVEIGVQTGKFSKVLCEANPEMLFYGIDPWIEGADAWFANDVSGIDQSSQEKGYEIAKGRVPDNCILIRKKSMEAVKDFPDEFFDFVYVDGNHEFVSAASDIHYWLKKVKKGGIMSGHDYRKYYPSSNIHVVQVVGAYTYGYGIKPWFITDGESVRSFFWVKE